MHKQEVTIYDVAREAKVSMATVSRVVNGNSNVRKETRDRVLEVIKRLHYQPNAVAQGLASKRTTTVGLIVPDLTNLYFAELSRLSLVPAKTTGVSVRLKASAASSDKRLDI